MEDATVIENTTDLLAGVNRALGQGGSGQNVSHAAYGSLSQPRRHDHWPRSFERAALAQ
jgi:hypothetical protein